MVIYFNTNCVLNHNVDLTNVNRHVFNEHKRTGLIPSGGPLESLPEFLSTIEMKWPKFNVICDIFARILLIFPSTPFARISIVFKKIFGVVPPPPCSNLLNEPFSAVKLWSCTSLVTICCLMLIQYTYI
jgi:hypothetical protein